MFPDLEFIKTVMNGLRSRIEKVENWTVSEAQTAQAVADYFAENPIIESDPTVPEWAKQPQKPTYTAAEIGAQPDMYVTNFDSVLGELTEKSVVYVASAGSTSPIPSDRYPVLLMRSGINMGQAAIVAYDAAGKTWAGSVNLAQGTIGLVERTLTASDIGAIPAPATAEVGQAIVVKAVDETGQPTGWEAVDMASGADGKSAYQYAQEGGYTGTEAEFAAKLAEEMPDNLPNPNALTFTGAVTGSYDGSAPLSVEIPGGGGGSGGAVGWKLIRTINIVSGTPSYSFDTDNNGNAFNVKNFLILIDSYPSDGYLEIKPNDNFSFYQKPTGKPNYPFSFMMKRLTDTRYILENSTTYRLTFERTISGEYSPFGEFTSFSFWFAATPTSDTTMYILGEDV